jgi:S-adenosylmethionine:tRNA ribosyltransferase-isomerase
LRVSDFEYDLPPELIAQHPLERRDASRLLVLDKRTGAVSHHLFAELPDLLRPDDVLVFNQSKVIPARLHGHKQTGGQVEFLLVQPTGDDSWRTMTRPGLKVGQHATFGAGADTLSATVVVVEADGLRVVRFDRAGRALHDAIWRLGELPTPPYVHEHIADPDRYQTVFARIEGSVAAPTAGLHFTPEMLDHLRVRGHELEFVTLHVGLGTFQPVKVEELSEHEMHRERCEVAPDVAARLTAAKRAGRRIVAVGTTAARTLESATDGSGEIHPFLDETGIFIYPGYQFRAVDALITNFHLPRSTLLMLVSALAGRENVLAAYREAVRERYRFFSFGDAMFIA